MTTPDESPAAARPGEKTPTRCGRCHRYACVCADHTTPPETYWATVRPGESFTFARDAPAPVALPAPAADPADVELMRLDLPDHNIGPWWDWSVIGLPSFLGYRHVDHPTRDAALAAMSATLIAWARSQPAPGERRGIITGPFDMTRDYTQDGFAAMEAAGRRLAMDRERRVLDAFFGDGDDRAR